MFGTDWFGMVRRYIVVCIVVVSLLLLSELCSQLGDLMVKILIQKGKLVVGDVYFGEVVDFLL